MIIIVIVRIFFNMFEVVIVGMIGVKIVVIVFKIWLFNEFFFFVDVLVVSCWVNKGFRVL